MHFHSTTKSNLRAHKKRVHEKTGGVGVLRIHLKTHSGEKSSKYSQCNYASSQFEDTFENSQWKKVKQMQQM